MPYYRRPYKRPRYAKRDKYSVQQKCVEISTVNDTDTSKVEIVPGTDVEGMRKVKHLTVTVAPEMTDGSSFYWAIVYVPQGTTPGNINVTATGAGMYEPNQFVMNCGIVSSGAGPIRFSSPVARNLNDGDGIYMLIRALQAALTSTIVLCVMLSPSSDHHITPQIYISYEICGARRCSIPNTPSGAGNTIPAPSYLN